MYSGIGGMRGFQNKLDVIGNNIANVNTIGFKKSRIMFQDILSQTMSGGSAPAAIGTNGVGGTNAKQVGLGSTISAIDVIHTGGNLQTTNVPSDVAIEGNGFFMVQDANSQYFLTRAGNFTFDTDGYLVTSNGMFVVDTAGDKIKIPATGTMKDVKSYSIGQDGKITYTDNAGNTATTTTGIGLAMVSNPGGLEKAGSNLYKITAAADPDYATPDTLLGSAASGSRGVIRSSTLEMSNVDLAEEFTEMIVAQRGFQANSRIITTSDSILEELVNLKR
jgi:flagellar hook protein FlgE